MHAVLFLHLTVVCMSAVVTCFIHVKLIAFLIVMKTPLTNRELEHTYCDSCLSCLSERRRWL